MHPIILYLLFFPAFVIADLFHLSVISPPSLVHLYVCFLSVIASPSLYILCQQFQPFRVFPSVFQCPLCVFGLFIGPCIFLWVVAPFLHACLSRQSH